jgi:hypothetical protein
VARSDDTAPIEILGSGTGRHLSLRGRHREETKPEPDAPREPNHATPSELITQTVDDVLAIARAEKPDASQVARLGDSVKLLATLAEAGLAAVQSKSAGGNGGNNGWIVAMIGVLTSLGLTIGIPTFASVDDVAAAKLAGEQNAAALIVLQARQDKIEAEKVESERTQRRALGLTIRWLGDEQSRRCKDSEAIAEGVNWLVKRELARKPDPDAEFVSIKIDCDESPLIPPELEKLRAEARDTL